MSWYKVINSAGDIPKIVVNGYIGVEFDNKPPVTFESFRNEFVALEAANKRCTMLINSGGGDMATAFAMFDLVKNSPMVVDVQIFGIAASSAAWLAMAGDSVSMAENSFLMLHKPQAGTGGEASNLRSMADYMDKLELRVANIITAKCGKPVADVQKEWLQPNVEKWFTAAEALEAGLIDNVIKPLNDVPVVRNWASVDGAWQVYKAFNITKPEETIYNNTMDKKAIITVLNAHKVQHSLTETSTDADVQAVLNAVFAENASLTQKLADVQTKLDADATQRATNLVTKAIADGKITEAEKEAWLTNAKASYEFVENALSKMVGRVDVNKQLAPANAAPGTVPAGDGKVANTRESWTLREWEKNDPTNLAKMVNSEPEKYAALFEAEYGVKP